MIRMGLAIFHRDNVKAFVYFERGSVPTNEEMITAFSNFLHLPDEDQVVHHINTQGRLTQGMLNFRSKGESNATVKEELKEAKLRKSLLSENSSVATLLTKKKSIKNEKLKQEIKKDFQNSLLPSLIKDKLYDIESIEVGNRSRPLTFNLPIELGRLDSMSVDGSLDGSQTGLSSLSSLSNAYNLLVTSFQII
jgi:hypothetical protein